jgi:uncharacterized protein YndB with AHSA1/START domain
VRAVATTAYEITARSAAPPARVFALLADATTWPRWAGPFIATAVWETEGEPPPGGAGAIRKVGRWPLFGREQIIVVDPPTHLGYTLLSGQPVRNYRADIYLAPDGDGTHITWGGQFDPLIPGTGGLVAAWFRRLIGGFADRVARYAEDRPE